MRRILTLIPVFLIVSLIVFSLMYLIPGDPVIFMLGLRASKEEIARVSAALGLDKPPHIQYLIFLWNLLHGDLGRSIFSKQPVLPYVLSKLPNTMLLAVSSMIVAIAIGIPAGVISATKQYSLFDMSSTIIALAGVSMPSFWMGLLLIFLFSLHLGWLPASGMGSVEQLIMPSLTLGTGMAAVITRLTRSSMLEVIRKDYIRTARAKGLAERVVIYKHALRNALIPVVTIVGLQFSYLLGGAFIVEAVFAWPGMGRLAIQAMRQRDYPVIQGVLLVTTSLFLLTNLVIDILYRYIDPRVHYD